MDKNSQIPGARKERSLIFIFIVLLAILLGTVLVHIFINPRTVSVEIASWYDDNAGAYSIIHDDLCLSDCYGIIQHADTIAHNRDIRIAMGASVEACSNGGDSLWAMLTTIVDHGHEIISHGWNHGSSVELDWTPMDWNHETDVLFSKELIEEMVPNASVNWFIFPYDAYSDQRIEELKDAGYLGARAGKVMYQDRGINYSHIEYDPFRTIFDAYMNKAEQDALDSSDNPYTTSINDDDNGNVAIQHLDNAIATKGWSLQEMHTVDTLGHESWGMCTVEEYRNLLDHAVEKRNNNELWVETPTTVAKYAVTRQGLDSMKLTGNKLSFASRPDDVRYNSPISLVFTTKNNPDSLSIWQNGIEIFGEKRGENKFVLTVDAFDDMVIAYKKEK